MSKIITLKDRITQEPIYPITSTSAVLDENGKTVDTIISEKFNDIDNKSQEVILQAQAAEESITSLTNLSNTGLAQDEINKLKNQIETNKSNISALTNNFSELKNTVNELVKTEDLINNIDESGSSNRQIPTTSAIKSYVQEKSLDLMNYIVDTTTVTPNYIPKLTGQVLVNIETNLIYFSPGGSTVWYSIQAEPLELPETILDGNLIGEDMLELIGDVYVDQEMLIIDSGGEIDETTLIITGDEINGVVNDSILSIPESPNSYVENKTLILKGSNVIVNDKTVNI